MTEPVFRFNIDDDTARSWLSRREERGREGLENAPRPGVPFKADVLCSKLAIDLLYETLHKSQNGYW